MINQWKENYRNGTPITGGTNTKDPKSSATGGSFIDKAQALQYMDEWERYINSLEELTKLTSTSELIKSNQSNIIALSKQLQETQLIQFELFADIDFIHALSVKVMLSKKLRISLGINAKPKKDILTRVNNLPQNKKNSIKKSKMGCVVIVTED